MLVCKSCCCCSGGRSDLAEVGSEDPRSKSEDERYRELMSRLVAAYAAGQVKRTRKKHFFDIYVLSFCTYRGWKAITAIEERG